MRTSFENVLTLGFGSSLSPSSSLLSLEKKNFRSIDGDHIIPFHTIPLHTIACYCIPLHTMSGATAATQPIQTTETNLRVSISMFISGLWTVLALLVVGPVTFIDEAMFSILRCLIVVFVCSGQRRLVFPKKSNNLTLPRLQVFIRGHFLDVQLHGKRSEESSSQEYSQVK